MVTEILRGIGNPGVQRETRRVLNRLLRLISKDAGRPLPTRILAAAQKRRVRILMKAVIKKCAQDNS